MASPTSELPASEALIEQAGLDESSAMLSAVRQLLEDRDIIDDLNAAVNSRTEAITRAVGYEIAGGYGQVSRDLTTMQTDYTAAQKQLGEQITRAYRESTDRIAAVVREAGWQDGMRIMLRLPDGKMLATYVSREIGAEWDRSAAQQGAL